MQFYSECALLRRTGTDETWLELGWVSVIPAGNAREFCWQDCGIPLRYANVLIYIRRDSLCTCCPIQVRGVLWHVAALHVAQILSFRYCICHCRDVHLLEINIDCCGLIAAQISHCVAIK